MFKTQQINSRFNLWDGTSKIFYSSLDQYFLLMYNNAENVLSHKY